MHNCSRSAAIPDTRQRSRANLRIIVKYAISRAAGEGERESPYTSPPIKQNLSAVRCVNGEKRAEKLARKRASVARRRVGAIRNRVLRFIETFAVNASASYSLKFRRGGRGGEESTEARNNARRALITPGGKEGYESLFFLFRERSRGWRN